MIRFKAYTYESKTYINSNAYQAGEILTQYLNLDFSPLARYYAEAFNMPSDISMAADVDSFHKAIEVGQNFITYIDSLLPTCPLMKDIFQDTEYKEGKLISLCEENRHLYEDENIEEHEMNDEKVLFRQNVAEIFYPYFTFVQDVVRVQAVYTPLLDQYIHTGATMPNAVEIAKAITHFYEDKDYEKYNEMFDAVTYQPVSGLIPAKNVTIAYESVPVEMPGGMQNVLCQTITYDSLGAFLYQELMNGLLAGMPPKRCKNCAQFFLLENGYYTDYCEDIAPGETMKTCRDVGARKRFDEKVKQDPVWLAYQRAYKAHYARVMKKKMTKPDFAAWSEMAIDLRTKALNKKIPFDEYARIIKE